MRALMTPAWLGKHGIDGSANELKAFSRVVQDAWVMRSGLIIAAQLTEDQVVEYEQAGDEEASLAVLQKYVPGYKTIVEQEGEALQREFAAASNKRALLERWAQEYSVK